MKFCLQYLFGTALLVLVLNSPVQAGSFYLGILGGGSLLTEAKASDPEGSVNFDYDGGFDWGVTAGYDLGNDYPNIGNGRVEIEFNGATNDLDQAEFVEGSVAAAGSVERTSIMFNTIGEYVTESGMIIYALLGLGWAEITMDNVAILGEPFADDSDSQLGYQAGIGLGWKFSNHLVADFSYRFYGTTDPAFTKKDGTSIDYEYRSHRLLAGIRLQF